MKKAAIALLVLVLLLGAAYAGGAWYLGGQVEAVVAVSQKQVEGMPYAKVLRREYNRGVFTSTEVVSYELFGDMLRSMQKMQKPGAPGFPVQPLVLVKVSHIRHGPLPDGKTPAAAIIDTDIEVEDRLKPVVAKVLGDKKMLTLHTIVQFDGSGDSAISSPAFVYSVPAAGNAPPDQVSWGGVTASLHFSPGMAESTFQGDAPKLEISNAASSGHLRVAGMHIEGTNKRIFDDEPLLSAGKVTMSIAEIALDAPALPFKAAQFRKLSYDVTIASAGEFVDVVGKLGAVDATISEINYGPAHYDFSARHLHARTLAQMQRTMMQVNADPAGAAGKDPAAAIQAITAPMMKLLQYNPEVSIDRIGFRLPEGNVELVARAKLVDARAEDFQQPQALLAKLDAGAGLTLPASLLQSQFGIKADSPEALAAQMQARQRQVAALLEHGYLQQDGAMVRTTVEFRNQQLLVNGQPFDPGVLQAASQPPAPVRQRAPAPPPRRGNR